MARLRTSTLLRYIGFAGSVLLLICFISPIASLVSTPLQQYQNRYYRHDQVDTQQEGGRGQQQPIGKTGTDSTTKHSDKQPPTTERHPIDHLVNEAENTFQKLLANNSKNISDAAAAYRKRRGRHPPPGFDEWYKFAAEHDTIIVEEFWDQIYHDLNPFWALPPEKIKGESRAFEMSINIRRGHAMTTSNWFWTQIWLEMIQTIEHLLPDMDIALNAMDEPRIVVPWEKMQEYIKTAKQKTRMVKADDVMSQFQRLPLPKPDNGQANKGFEKNWITSGIVFSIFLCLERKLCADR